MPSLFGDTDGLLIVSANNWPTNYTTKVTSKGKSQVRVLTVCSSMTTATVLKQRYAHRT